MKEAVSKVEDSCFYSYPYRRKFFVYVILRALILLLRLPLFICITPVFIYT